MKVKFYITCLLGFLGIGVQSCIKDANVKLPVVVAEPVVHCYISPQDKIIRVDLFYSRPIYGQRNNNEENFKPITGAMVKISGNNQTVQLLYDQLEQAYMIPASAFVVAAGTNYNLQINTADGKSLNASCWVPAQLNTNLKAVINETREGSKITFEWDELASGSYYRASAISHYNVRIINTITNKDTVLSIDEAVLMESGEYQYGKSKYVARSNNVNDDGDSIVALLLTTDRHYYNYHNSLNNYSGGDDPFAEATGIYTNINGGHGVFAGFQTYRKKVDN